MKSISLLVLCFAIFLSSCGKAEKMPKPTQETCDGNYLDKHRDIYRRLLKYTKPTANNLPGIGDLKADAPDDVIEYAQGCLKGLSGGF
ncbi:MAG: hypothetical protein IJ934_00205 [Acetobacter sp.]|nr:hypothetical protein [Acetobacter sp.]